MLPGPMLLKPQSSFHDFPKVSEFQHQGKKEGPGSAMDIEFNIYCGLHS